ncbi:hypothetical protein J1N35_010992 [Gossypium stocksii]|uniref:Uncharacterized protein n=1 Tax=Gossypium stocksii TaxID=47602 RepID=A0A9D3W1N7_9ROSI|nr:hypothetical protein J1N35_010992 [Gossypium stocksii]
MLYSILREKIEEEVIGFKRPMQLRPLIRVGFFRTTYRDQLRDEQFVVRTFLITITSLSYGGQDPFSRIGSYMEFTISKAKAIYFVGTFLNLSPIYI